MDHDQTSAKHEPFVITQAEPRRPSGRAILVAGVAGACALGVGFGLWARPGAHEGPARTRTARAEPTATAPGAPRKLEILIAGRPRAPQAPAPVAPAPPAAAPQPQPVPRLIEAKASPAPPTVSPREPTGLETIAAAFAGAKLALGRLEHPQLEPAAYVASPPARAEDKSDLLGELARQAEIARFDAAKAEVRRAALARAEAERAAAAKAAAAHKAQLAGIEQAKAEAARAEAHRLALAQAAERRQELAGAEAARTAAAHSAAHNAAHRLQLARAAQAERAESARLAKAEARARAAQREEAHLEALAEAAEAQKRVQLNRLAKAMAHAVADRSHAAAIEQARLERRRAEHQARLEPVAARRRHEPSSRPATAHPRARPEFVQAPPSGLMRVSDPGLSAAERQVARAYQGARAAGVPDEELQIGQERWLAARHAAEREAPWALRDVYMARIAELNGQAREAQQGY